MIQENDYILLISQIKITNTSNTVSLTQELGRLGWSVPSAWREIADGMQTRRYNGHSDIQA